MARIPTDAAAHPPAPGGITRTTMVLAAVMVVALIWLGAATIIRREKHAQDSSLNGDMDETTGAVATTLMHTPPAGRKPLLMRYLATGGPSLRYAAADALGEERGPDVTAALEAEFRDSASAGRQRAMEVLPNVDRTQGFLMMLAALRDEDDWIREAAVQQMMSLVAKPGSMIDRRAVPALICALDDEDSVVQAAASGILQRITGKPWRFRNRAPAQVKKEAIAHWKDWWLHTAPLWNVPPRYAGVPRVRPDRADPAPDFHLTDVEGQAISRDALRGHITLLNFWGTWCPPCMVEIPALEQLNSEYRGKGVNVIGVALSQPDGAAGLKTWCAAHGVRYRQALSNDDTLDAFGHIHEVPVSVLIDAAGRLRYRWDGERDFATYHAAVQRLLEEPAPH